MHIGEQNKRDNIAVDRRMLTIFSCHSPLVQGAHETVYFEAMYKITLKSRKPKIIVN